MTGPITAITHAIVNAFNFSGRSTRSEFWWPYAAVILVSIIASVFDAMMMHTAILEHGDMGIFTLSVSDFASIYVFAITIVPVLSMSVRRLHDAGFSGFWLLISFIPVIGGIALQILYILPSTTPHSSYGPSKTSSAARPTGTPVTKDAHQRAMQGYALLFEKDKPVSPEQQAARKAEISDYYRTRVLKPAASA